MNLKYEVSLINNIDKISDDVLVKTFQRAMLEIQNQSKINAPVDTGVLRNSILLNVIDDRNIDIDVFVPYASYVEFGTSNPNYPMQPYLRPAIDEIKTKRLKSIVQSVMNENN